MHFSRPYHPQSQRKTERSQRELRKKINYDMIKLRKKGVNWVQNLPSYMRVLNEYSREELSWKSPFEVYYGRMPNNIQNVGRYITKQVIVEERITDYRQPEICRKEKKKLKSNAKGSKKATEEWTKF